MQVRIHEMIKKSGKTILQIASETGLNRNTISGLANGQVDGLRLSTLQAFQKAYGWRLEDMLEEESQAIPLVSDHRWYKQETELIPFTCWPWALASCTPYAVPQISAHGEELRFYARDLYGAAYWKESAMNRWAEQIWSVYAERTRWERLFQDHQRSAQVLEDLYLNSRRAVLFPANLDHAREVYREISDAYHRFWCRSLFIDAFDVGVDQTIIRKLKQEYQISEDESHLLLTPPQLTFDRERRLALLSLVMRFCATKQKLALEDWLLVDAEAKKFIQVWGFVHNNYARAKNISLQEVQAEIEEVLKQPDQGKVEFMELQTYEAQKESAIKALINQRGWKDNPLAFFAHLTYWREQRKKTNLMGIHVLCEILRVLESFTGIPQQLLAHMIPDEIEAVLHGTITRAELERRKREGMMFVVTSEGYRLHVGAEAKSLQDECETSQMDPPIERVLAGQVASQGYAKGVARVILSEKDFSHFKEGEILVTGMTRPEFVPLMKRAAGIVTNEGGISCHAAIVARELGKPCVIGTRRATEVIKDGDIVEVRANHGTVRVLKSG